MRRSQTHALLLCGGWLLSYVSMSAEPFTLPSFAKINLHLRVLGKRTDGYHELCTVFQTISQHDDITFETASDLVLTCSDPAVPTDDRNLIVKAALALRERFGVSFGVRIHVEKRIPSPGGLGGGSSNAAVVLLGLTKLWEIDADSEELHGFAASFGADVPYFLFGGTALGTGRGTEIEIIDEIEEKHIIVVTPDIAVSTRDAFERLNSPSLTNTDPESILNVCRFEARSLDLRQTALKNDFENTIFAAYPEIGKAKQTLLELGAVNALLSGSGASVFGIFENEETRQTALKALGNEANWRSFAVATISRDEYREKLGFQSGRFR